MADIDITKTCGALMVGGFIAAMFSGVVTSQAFSYFKHYMNDQTGVKISVGVVWLLDVFHIIFIWYALWDHLIVHFGDISRTDFIHWSLALTIALTAILTFLVHLFFVYRIFKLSMDSFVIAIPLALLATARLSFGCITTAKMTTLHSLKRFIELYSWSFTCDLSLSSLLDVLITSLLCYLLLQRQRKNSSMNSILDSLMLYTFENGSLTCAAAVLSLICWLAMHNNFIFMGIHFIIAKLYANSLLATLNARKNLRQIGHRSQYSNSSDRTHAIMFQDSYDLNRQSLKIKVDQTRSSRSDSSSGTIPADAKTSKDIV